MIETYGYVPKPQTGLTTVIISFNIYQAYYILSLFESEMSEIESRSNIRIDQDCKAHHLFELALHEWDHI